MHIVAFQLDGQRYGIELSLAQRVVPMVAIAPVPEAPAVALGAINLHGLVVPVLDVRRRRGLPDRRYALSTCLLIAQTTRRTLALPVDEVLGVFEIDGADVTPPHAVLPGIERVAGIAALPDGLLFIYDLEAFLNLDEEQQLTQALQALDV